MIYQAGDDVDELLIPFIAQNKGIKDTKQIEELYLLASLGKIAAVDFWRKAGIDPSLEDQYLVGHTLFDGFLDFMNEVKNYYSSIMCLSNDVSEWSIKLRKTYGLEKMINNFIISGDVGVRKPSSEIYQNLLDATNSEPENITLVDDNPINLDAAAKIGINTILFGDAYRSYCNSPPSHKKAVDYDELAAVLFDR